MGHSEAFEEWKKEMNRAASHVQMAAEHRARARVKSAEMRKHWREVLKARQVEAHRAELDQIADLAKQSVEADRSADAIRLARDTAIVAAVKAGLSTRLIGEHAGLSHTIVQRISARAGITKRPRPSGRSLPPEAIARDAELAGGE